MKRERKAESKKESKGESRKKEEMKVGKNRLCTNGHDVSVCNIRVCNLVAIWTTIHVQLFKWFMYSTNAVMPCRAVEYSEFVFVGTTFYRHTAVSSRRIKTPSL